MNVHIKDSGTILLTKDDYAEFLAGRVSARIQQMWELDYEQLNSFIKGGNYKVIDDNNGTETRTIKNISGESTEGSTE